MMVRLLDLSGLFWRTWAGSAGKDVSYTWERVMGRVAELAHVRDGNEGNDGAMECAIAICLDSRTSWRRELDARYKANRPIKDSQALEQLARCIEDLRAKGYPVWEAEGMEADDVIASACLSPTLATHEIQIATTDKDLLALVDEGRVRWLSLATNELRGPKEVMATFEVLPEQMRDLLALAGDSSDNVPGADGVGLKHAAKLLARFTDLDGILAAAQEPGRITPPSIEKAIHASLGDIDRSARLVTLRTDVVLPFEEVLAPRVPRAVAAAQPAFEEDHGDDDEGELEHGPTEPAPPPRSAPRAVPPAAVPSATETPAADAPAPPPAPPPIASSASFVEAPPPPAMIVPRTQNAGELVASTTDPRYMLALEPMTANNAFTLSRYLYDSGLFRQHDKVESIFAIILTGRSMGLDSMTSLRGIDIVEGKPRVTSSMLIGLILRSKLAKYFQLVETNERFATYRTWRIGAPKEVELTFTIEEAERMGKLRPPKPGRGPGPWLTMPKTMLRRRCESGLAGIVYPDVCANVYTPADLDDEIDEAA